MKKNIAIFTGNRAEYGLQFPILKAVREHKNLDYSLIVSGAHLDTNFGNTLQEINDDGFEIYKEVKIEMDAGSLDSTVNAIGSGILSIGETLSELKPDIFVVYADRFEGLAAVIASTQMNIPTAHIEGGDLTEGGALDDSVRHAMTKLSHIHFTTNQEATNRLLAMGEEPWRVHTAGFPAIDMISEGNYATEEEILESLNLNLSEPIILFTQHSVTTEFDKSELQLQGSLEAIEKISKTGVQCILTYPNNDAGGKQIIKCLKELEEKDLDNVFVRRSLGRYLYHGILALSLDRNKKIICMGNSSSGIKETPVFGCPTINIGSRQLARLRGSNVIDTGYTEGEITEAIYKCLNNKKFRNQCHETDNPYYVGGAGYLIANVLDDMSLNQKLIRKKMLIRGEVDNGWFR